MAIARHAKMAIIADEVFLDFALDGNALRAIAANRWCCDIYMSGLSKIPGCRR